MANEGSEDCRRTRDCQSPLQPQSLLYCLHDCDRLEESVARQRGGRTKIRSYEMPRELERAQCAFPRTPLVANDFWKVSSISPRGEPFRRQNLPTGLGAKRERERDGSVFVHKLLSCSAQTFQTWKGLPTISWNHFSAESLWNVEEGRRPSKSQP